LICRLATFEKKKRLWQATESLIWLYGLGKSAGAFFLLLVGGQKKTPALLAQVGVFLIGLMGLV